MNNVNQEKIFLNGEWVIGKNMFEVRSPYSKKIVAQVPDLSPEEVEPAIRRAKTYRSELTAQDRSAVLLKVEKVVESRREELSRCITDETGLCLKSARHELERALQAVHWAAEETKRLNGIVFPADIVSGVRDRIGFTLYEPIGLVLAITPFNHPLNQVVHKVVPAIAANNSVILKPSEKAPVTAIRFIEILLECGLPKEMINLVTCKVGPTTELLVSHSAVDMVVFTGSTETGERVHRMMGVKKSIFELGDISALIVLEDADIEQAVEIAVKGAFGNSGQRCTSIKRILVDKKIADVFAEKFVEKTRKLKTGDPYDATTDVGSVISEEAAQDIEFMIQKAQKDGARILCGGTRNGALVTPTILDHVSPTSEIVTREVFGPTAPIIRVENPEEALSIVNNSHYGLQAGVCTNNLERMRKFVRELSVGAVMINEGPGFRIEPFPFGGVKKSGFGKEGISSAIRAMSHEKLVVF